MVRVHNLVPPDVWEQRYDEINAFERELVDAGTTVVKVAMFVSLTNRNAGWPNGWSDPTSTGNTTGRCRRAQAVARLSGGLPSRARPDLHRLRAVVRRPVRQEVVQPTGRHRTTHLGLKGLAEMTWPPADFDVQAEQKKLAASSP